MTDNRTTDLREKLTEHGVDYEVKDLSNIKFFHDTRWNANGVRWCYTEFVGATTCLTMCNEWKDCTPEQAIAATLGSDKPPYDELLRCLENDWHIRASWDCLRKFWCIELTEEGVKLRDVTHGTLTAGQVRDAIEQHSMWVIGNNRCFRDGAYEEIADELNAELGSEINGETSDGYHTFNELYHHRAVLFSVIVRDHRELAWKARKHHDGTMYEGMFIVGIETPKGQATYHYDLDPYWEMFDCEEREFAPEWDGHTPDEAIARIAELGSGTCNPEETETITYYDEYGHDTVKVHVMECDECGGTYEHVYGEYERCPRCGKKAVEYGDNVNDLGETEPTVSTGKE